MKIFKPETCKIGLINSCFPDVSVHALILSNHGDVTK